MTKLNNVTTQYLINFWEIFLIKNEIKTQQRVPQTYYETQNATNIATYKKYSVLN